MLLSLLLSGLLVAVATPVVAAENWTPVQSTKWVPIPPSGAGSFCELTGPAGEPLRGRWRMLDAGDTLQFEVRGSGMLRVETRAMLSGDANSARYRIGVRTAPSIVRPLVRKSGSPAPLSIRCGDRGESLVRVAEVDQWETPLVEGSERVDVFVREDRPHPILVRVLAQGDIERPRSSGDPASDGTNVEWGSRVGTLGAGFTTNAYLAPTDSNKAETAFFWPANLRIGATIEPGKKLDLDFGYGFDGVFFKDTILNVYRHNLDARQRWSRVSLGSLGEAKVSLEEAFKTKTRTFFGRGYDEEFETAAGNPPADQSYLADRFNWREFFVGADVEIAATREFTYGVSAGYVRKDYVEDYENDPDTYALDWGGFAGGVRAEWRNEADYYVALGGAVRDRSYDEKFSRDASGVVVRDVPSHLSYWPVDLEVGQYPFRGFRWKIAAQRERIIDHYDGYWDRTYWRFLIGGTLAMRDGHRVRFRVARSVTDYDRSRVGNVPTGPIREKDGWRIGGEGIYVLGEHWRITGALEYLDRNNNSPTFDYSLLESWAGLSWEF